MNKLSALGRFFGGKGGILILMKTTGRCFASWSLVFASNEMVAVIEMNVSAALTVLLATVHCNTVVCGHSPHFAPPESLMLHQLLSLHSFRPKRQAVPLSRLLRDLLACDYLCICCGILNLGPDLQ